jgi:hypothetical protein
MTRTAIASLALLLVTACAHDRDRSETTTITSGSPGGVRVTNVTIGEFDPAERLAGELCQREATCGRIEGSGTDEAKLLGEQNCVTTKTPGLRQRLRAWPCSPAASGGRFEECLAAVRSERCEARLDSLEALPACRANAVCAE